VNELNDGIIISLLVMMAHFFNLGVLGSDVSPPMQRYSGHIRSRHRQMVFATVPPSLEESAASWHDEAYWGNLLTV